MPEGLYPTYNFNLDNALGLLRGMQNSKFCQISILRFLKDGVIHLCHQGLAAIPLPHSKRQPPTLKT
jgi:hypothetical protein